jgi:predicted type IV restriction endonuclease
MAVQVEGLQELIRAFKVMPDDVVEEFTWELLEAAEPVRTAAQSKATTALSNMVYTRQWSGMRTGVSRRDTTVWVVPSLRGRRRIAPASAAAFAKGIQERALDPALEENTEKIINRIDDMLDRIAEHHGF